MTVNLKAHVLDQPILAALTTRHSHFAEGGPLAMRYHRDVSPLAAVADDSSEALAALAALLKPGDSVILARTEENAVPPGLVAEHVTQGVQMLAASVAPHDESIPVVELGDADAPEMLALATLTKPGPFAARTHEFGGYIGIRIDGRLAAMAGHRLKVPGFTEISAVCTHPDFRGKGFASYLTKLVAARIRASEDVPFLHAYAANTRAIALYEELGFVHRTKICVSVLRRA